MRNFLRLINSSTWLFVVLAFVCAETAYQFQWLERAENVYSDLWHRIAGVRHVPEHVALVVVDDATLQQYQDDPLVFWTPYYARAVQVADKVGARIVGIDLLFAASPENWFRKLNLSESRQSQGYDLPFRQAINSGHVVLVGAQLRGRESEADDFQLPHQDYLMAIPDFDLGARIGLADLMSDKDGGVRRFTVAPMLKLAPEMQAQNVPRLSLAALLSVYATNQDPHQASWHLGGRNVAAGSQMMKISYAGPPGTVARVPLGKLLAEGAENDPAVQHLKGKVVILGGEYNGMNDVHFTPYSTGFLGRSGNFMSGPEIHANIAETLLTGNYQEPLPVAGRIVFFILPIALALLLFRGGAPWRGVVIFFGISFLGGIVAYLAFTHYLDLPLANLQLGLGVGYVGMYGYRISSGERERERIKSLFGRYVSDSVVDLLLESDKLPDMGGESRQITVLFSDIRNFTTISEKLTPHEVVEMLNGYFEKACEPILREGGTIDKFIGDAVMAEFGSPLPDPNQAARALRAALDMRQVADEFRQWMQQRFAGKEIPEFHIGIGLHLGEAVIGNVGCSKRTEFTAIGDTVNIASRLEGVTKTLGCVIVASKELIDSAGCGVLTGKHEWVKVKGREQPVEVFEILGMEDGKGEG
ncbi:MAG: adenylate/guanylate cyclase domain-containing protein [Sterolibacterium sp.]|nr:adenylate/guanylate cyclase domain-containing protein [Sterolibacterium sp.]